MYIESGYPRLVVTLLAVYYSDASPFPLLPPLSPLPPSFPSLLPLPPSFTSLPFLPSIPLFPATLSPHQGNRSLAPECSERAAVQDLQHLPRPPLLPHPVEEGNHRQISRVQKQGAHAHTHTHTHTCTHIHTHSGQEPFWTSTLKLPRLKVGLNLTEGCLMK